MTKDKLMPLLKYFHGENVPPDDFNRVQQMWWSGEKLLYDNVAKDEDYFDKVLNLYREAVEQNGVSGVLADKKIDEDKRAIIYFLDIWHGKYFPYDSLDLIHEY